MVPYILKLAFPVCVFSVPCSAFCNQVFVVIKVQELLLLWTLSPPSRIHFWYHQDRLRAHFGSKRRKLISGQNPNLTVSAKDDMPSCKKSVPYVHIQSSMEVRHGCSGLYASELPDTRMYMSQEDSSPDNLLATLNEVLL